jgi:hypothetical protein
VYATDWPTIINAGAAVSTAVAAVIAALALRSSARAATAAERQTEAQTLPVILELPRGVYLPPGQEERIQFDDGHITPSPVVAQVLFGVEPSGPMRCSVAIQNVGTGMARVTAAYLWPGRNTQFQFLPPRAGPPTYDEKADVVYVAPGGNARLSLTAPGDAPGFDVAAAAFSGYEAIPLVIHYEDFAGVARFCAELTLSPSPGETSWLLTHRSTQREG